METLLLAAKWFGIIVAGVLGVIATTHDFKDSNEKLTKAGHLSILGIVASSVVALVAHGFEHHLALVSGYEATKENTRTSEKVLAKLDNLQRGLDSFDELSLFVETIVPLTGTHIGQTSNPMHRYDIRWLSNVISPPQGDRHHVK